MPHWNCCIQIFRQEFLLLYQGCFNIKMPSTSLGFPLKRWDGLMTEMVSWPSYLYNGNLFFRLKQSPGSYSNIWQDALLWDRVAQNSRHAWLTHWGRVTHICVGNLTIIGSDNGLSPGRRQAIIWTNAGILLIGPLRANFSEILIEI